MLLAEKTILPCVCLAFILALGAAAPTIAFQLQETGAHDSRSPIGIKGTETAVEISSRNLSCYDYAKYFVFVRGSTQGEMIRGDDILVRTKANKQEQILCKYGVKPGDFELKADLGQCFGGITNDLMLVDTGIGPNQERFLSVYNLSSQNQVYKTSYLEPIELSPSGQVSFWRMIKFATIEDCSNAKEVTSTGLRPILVKKFLLDLRTFDLQTTSLSRCGGLE